MKVKCNRCGYVGDESEFPTNRDFFQKRFIASCPKGCGNRQSPGDASLRMMPGMETPFSYVRSSAPDDPLAATFHRANEAS